MAPTDAPLLLASSSVTRRRMLEAAGVAVEIEPARVDEDEITASLTAAGASPRQIAESLAEAKAMRISAHHPTRLVLGADQVLSLGTQGVMGKAATRAAARDQLIRLRGQDHKLVSAAVMAFGGSPIWRVVDTATLTVRPFSDAFLEDYLAQMSDEVLASVGCYQLEGLGAQLFSQVRGDHFTILGLPLLQVLDYLRSRGALAA